MAIVTLGLDRFALWAAYKLNQHMRYKQSSLYLKFFTILSKVVLRTVLLTMMIIVSILMVMVVPMRKPGNWGGGG